MKIYLILFFLLCCYNSFSQTRKSNLDSLERAQIKKLKTNKLLNELCDSDSTTVKFLAKEIRTGGNGLMPAHKIFLISELRKFNNKLCDDLANEIEELIRIQHLAFDEFIDTSKRHEEIYEELAFDEESGEWISKSSLDSMNYLRLISIYSDSLVSLDSTKKLRYLNENIIEFKKLNDGYYQFVFNQNGILDPNFEMNFQNLESTEIKTIKVNGFSIPLPTEISFSVISNDSILVSMSYFANTTKAVFYEKSTNSFFFKEKPNTSRIKITRDESIDKNKLKVKYQYKNEKLVNGVLIESVDYPKEEIKEILKK